MPADLPSKENNDKNLIQCEFDGAPGSHMFLDVTLFLTVIRACYEAINSKVKSAQIQRLLSTEGWIEHYLDKKTGRRVLSETNVVEHIHEKQTAVQLAHMNYDVIFAPKGIFPRGHKKFDVYLLRDTIILEADLKCISSKNPNTVANHIKGGSEQASRVVLDIISDIDKKALIQGMRSGVYKNGLVKEILLFYRNKYYHLPKALIESKRIFEIIK